MGGQLSKVNWQSAPVCLFRLHCHIFVYTRGKYWSLLTTIAASIRRWRDPQSENVNYLRTILIILVISLSLGALKYQHELLTKFTDANSQLQWRNSDHLWLCTVFGRFVPNFACAAPLLDKKILEGQLQTFDGLTDDEIAALRRSKRNLRILPGWFFHVCNAPIQSIRTLASSQWMCSSAKAPWQIWQTNWMLIMFVRWGRAHIRHGTLRLPCSS